MPYVPRPPWMPLNMSLLSKISKFAGRLAKNPMIQAGIGAAFPGVGTLATRVASGLLNQPSAQSLQTPWGTMPSTLPTYGGFSTGGGFPTLPAATRAATNMPAVVSSTGCPPGYHLNKQDGKYGPKGTYCVKNRRMNVLNGRAAMRSIKRLKGARKMLQQIERNMPHRTVRARK